MMEPGSCAESPNRFALSSGCVPGSACSRMHGRPALPFGSRGRSVNSGGRTLPTAARKTPHS